MSTLVYKHDLTALEDTAPLFAKVHSLGLSGAVSSNGVGSARALALKQLDPDGTLSNYVISGADRGVAPDLHQLTIYQNGREISATQFYPIETSPGLIDVIAARRATVDQRWALFKRQSFSFYVNGSREVELPRGFILYSITANSQIEGRNSGIFYLVDGDSTYTLTTSTPRTVSLILVPTEV